MRESAKVFCAKGLLELMPRIWTLRAWNSAKSTFLADRLAVHVGPKLWT